jgi:hypothetical protein
VAVKLGPYFDGKHGPFAKEYAAGMLLSAIGAAESKPSLAELAPFAGRAKVLAAQLREGEVDLPDVPIVTFHGDFTFRNMLVDGEGDSLRISALLDWEWGGAKPAYCEFQDSSCGDVNVARGARFQAECERRGLLCPATMPGFLQYAALAELGEALDPWVVGCFSAERNLEEIVASKETCERLLSAHKL